MLTCCEIALALAVSNVVSLALFAGYTVKLKERTVKLEKKNGYEQHQIDELKKEIEQLKKKNNA